MLRSSNFLTDATGIYTWLRLHPTTSPSPITDLVAQQARPSAVLVPLFTAPDGSPHLLFTQRSLTLKHHRGEISFPGGRPDPEDQSLADTAIREAFEEIGLPRNRIELVGELPQVFTFVSNYLISPNIGWCHGTIAELTPQLNASEVSAVLDIPLAELANPANRQEHEFTRFDTPITVYSYECGGQTIWGATAQIVTHLLTLLATANENGHE